MIFRILCHFLVCLVLTIDRGAVDCASDCCRRNDVIFEEVVCVDNASKDQVEQDG